MKELKCELHIVGGALTGLLTAYCASCLNYNIIISEKKKIYLTQKKPFLTKEQLQFQKGQRIFRVSRLWQHTLGLCGTNS